MAKPSRRRITVRARRPDELALMGAAYVLTESAYVAVEKAAVHLWPKSGSGAALAEAFEAEYASQKVRWALLKKSRAARLKAVPEMLALAARLAQNATTVMPELEPERRREIEGLLAEGAQRDPLGISRPWEELRRKV